MKVFDGLRAWCWSLMALSLLPMAAQAADFSQGVTVSGQVATIWFKSSVNTSWVDVHYQLNGGGQQNLRMSYQPAWARHEQAVKLPLASAGATLSYFFTYNNGNPAYDSSRFSYTVSGATPAPVPTGAVCFYENPDFQGASFCSDASSAYVGANWNDRISSVKLRAGQKVTLYEHANQGGRSLVLTADAANLGAQGFNDLMSSFNLGVADSADLPVGKGVMTIKLTNATDGTYADSQVYWSIIGYNPSTRALSYVDKNGNLVPASVNDNNAANRLAKNGQTYSNYFYKMSEANWVSIPKIDSGRMFISVGSPMYIKINTAGDGRTGFAGPDMNNPSDPNQDVYFEWVEFTVDNYGYHGNTTRVDQFGFPLRTRLIGKDGYDRTLGETQSRAAIFADYEAQMPAEFRTLVQRPYRIVAPGKGAFNTGKAYGNYFDAYVSQVWSTYAGKDLVFTAEAGTFRGRVIGNDFVFSKDGGPQNLYVRGKPSTQAILEGSGNLASGNAQELVVQAQITAAFNRHLLINVDPSQWSNAAAYYPAGPANYYAKFWHDHSIDGLAYGFCYDDVRNKSSLQEYANPKGLIVTVGW
jgi:hypothetical protein